MYEFSCTDFFRGGILVTGRLSEERFDVTEVVGEIVGAAPSILTPSQKVVGSVDNSSGRAS